MMFRYSFLLNCQSVFRFPSSFPIHFCIFWHFDNILFFVRLKSVCPLFLFLFFMLFRYSLSRQFTLCFISRKLFILLIIFPLLNVLFLFRGFSSFDNFQLRWFIFISFQCNFCFVFQALAIHV